MALRKNIVLPSNFTAAYHRIAGVLIVDSARVMEIHLESYKDEATRRATRELDQPAGAVAPKFQPVANPIVKIDGADFAALFGEGTTPDYPAKATLYAFLKTQAQFAGATDV